MYKMLVSSCGSSVEIESNINLYNLINNKIDFIDFPKIILKEHYTNKHIKYKVKYTDCDNRILDYKNNKLIIQYPIAEMDNGIAILFMLYPLLELNRRNNKNLTCHAAAISINGKGIVLLGKEGAGKTTLAIELCKKYDAKIIGNDLCVIDYSKLDNLKILGGTQYFFLRYESIKRNMPQLLEKFKISNIENDIDSWLLKKKFYPKELNIRIEENVVNIDKFYIVHIDQEKNFLHKDARTLSNLLYLNENFSRYIRNTCTTMINKDKLINYIPSMDNEKFSTERNELINYLFDNKKIEYVSGNIKSVSDYILKGGGNI